MGRINFQAIKKQYFSTNKSLDQLAKDFNTNASYLREVAGKENWSGQKLKIQQKATQETAENIIETLSEVNTRHTLVWRQMQEDTLSIIDQEASLETLKAASQILKVAIEGERLALGLPVSSVKAIEPAKQNDPYEEKLKAMTNEEISIELGNMLNKQLQQLVNPSEPQPIEANLTHIKNML